jgi:hypothetical protein
MKILPFCRSLLECLTCFDINVRGRSRYAFDVRAVGVVKFVQVGYEHGPVGIGPALLERCLPTGLT